VPFAHSSLFLFVLSGSLFAAALKEKRSGMVAQASSSRVVGLWIVVQAREIKKKEDKSSPEPYVHTPPWFCSPLVLIFDRSWPIRRKVFAKNLLKIFLFSFDRGGTDYRKGKGECDSVRPIELMSWFQAARRRPRVCACPLSRQPAHMIFFKKIKVISYKKIRTRNNVT
jgi:hypothetical protein